jgi:long-chain acyl-CoA synthetase
MDTRHMFVQSLQRLGDQRLFIEGERYVTLEELAVSVVALSDLLRVADTSETGNVAILLPNTTAFVAAFYGATFAGKTPVPTNPLIPPQEMIGLFRDIGVKTILTASPVRPLIEGLEKCGLEGAQVFYLDEMRDAMDEEARAAMAERCHPSRLEKMLEEEPNELACMLFSSGTTGRPKAVMLTHENLISNNQAILECFSVCIKDGIYGALPFFHSYGLCCLHLALWGGCRFFMAPRFSPGSALRAVREHRLNVLMLVPEMWRLLLKSDALVTIDWASVRLALGGGAPVSIQLRDEWEKATEEPLYAGYGLTEFSPVIAIGVPGRHCRGSVGKPLAGVEVRIVDEQGQEIEVGREGEIWARGPSCMKGYYGNTEATAGMLDSEGWLHTGDHGKVDAVGYLFVGGRKKDIIIVAGENVLPEEVEEALTRHPAVAEAAVIGVPDPTRGEVPKGFAVLASKGAADASELRMYLHDNLAPFKIPKEIVLVDELPKNAMGKVLKIRLRDPQPAS